MPDVKAIRIRTLSPGTAQRSRTARPMSTDAALVVRAAYSAMWPVLPYVRRSRRLRFCSPHSQLPGGEEADVVNEPTRRGFVRGLAAGALIAGFDPVTRHWVPSAPVRGFFAHVPPLDGRLLFDDADRAAAADDFGHIVHRRPVAVLQPGSIED